MSYIIADSFTSEYKNSLCV